MLVDLFRRNGFRCEDVHVHERQVENRGKALTMDRRWIQALFTYDGRQENSPPGWRLYCDIKNKQMVMIEHPLNC